MTTPTVPPGPRYRCREHLDQAVTWRGTGCPDCAQHIPARTVRERRATRIRAAAEFADHFMTGSY